MVLWLHIDDRTVTQGIWNQVEAKEVFISSLDVLPATNQTCYKQHSTFPPCAQ